MWLCKKCKHKNNNSSEKCHGHNCKGKRDQSDFETPIHKRKQVLDLCPKCNQETVFVFERNKMIEVEELTPGMEGMQARRVKTRVEKRYRCTQCQSLCRQTGKSKMVPEEMKVGQA